MAKLTIILPDGNSLSQELNEEKTTIGRLADNDIQIEDSSVSSHHAEILMSGSSVLLRDLNSTNGTTVNDNPISECILSDGDKIRFGNVSVIFSSDEKEDKGVATADSALIELVPGNFSIRPIDFVSTSPFPKIGEKKNTLRTAALIVAAVSLILSAISIICTFTILSLPEFPVP
ncbi:MAG: FHA domain-containing protein [Chthoniobacterales bacterium]|nr:FHA domain-containing protein [Chthoniobacterales bacterium]